MKHRHFEQLIPPPNQTDWAAEFEHWKAMEEIARQRRENAARRDRFTRRLAGAVLLLTFAVAAFQLSRFFGLLPIGAIL